MNGLQATYIDHMGSDLRVANNARVSFAKQSTLNPDGSLRKGDIGLIRFLADGMRTMELEEFLMEVSENGYRWVMGESTIDDGNEYKAYLWENLKKFRRTPTHWVPFANGNQIQFHIEAPIPIMRQVFKHKVGAVESEESRRYIDGTPKVFMPEFRRKAVNVKQGSSDEVFEPDHMVTTMFDPWGHTHNTILDYEDVVNFALEFYEHLIVQGVAPEQARFVLPQGAVSQAIICNSLYGWANFFNARSDVQHAQREIAVLAEQVGAVCEQHFPVSWKALTQLAPMITHWSS